MRYSTIVSCSLCLVDVQCAFLWNVAPAFRTKGALNSATAKSSIQPLSALDGSLPSKDVFSTEVALTKSVLDDATCQEIDGLVRLRGQSRWEGNYEVADRLRLQLDQSVTLLPHPNMDLVLEDVPRRLGGGSHWSLVLRLSFSQGDDDDENVVASRIPSVLNLAHAALGMVALASERSSGRLSAADVAMKQSIVNQTRNQLQAWFEIHSSLDSNTQTCLDNNPFLLSLSQPSNGTTNENNRRIRDWIAVETQLRGRKAADAAFWFALAGVQDADIYEWLVEVTMKEIKRFGDRPSCRIKDIMAMVDRLAAAGIQQHPELETVVNQILDLKQQEPQKPTSNTTKRIASSRQAAPTRRLLNLHSDNCALRIWKFSTRQRKQKTFLLRAAKHWETTKSDSLSSTTDQTDLLEMRSTVFAQPLYNWSAIFDDPSRPLVVDVGCGMGVSLLGLASASHFNDQTSKKDDPFMSQHDAGQLQYDWSQCNFLGVDLSALAIGYANNIAKRWNLQGQLCFAVDDAKRLLKAVAESYPGQVSWILVQFPTPYRLLDLNNTTSSIRGNSQLPVNASDGFMVSTELLQEAAKALSTRHHCPCDELGRLLLQSNCEDVAVGTRDLACQELFEIVHTTLVQTETSMLPPTQRGKTWINMGGTRAMGPGWWSQPLLPRPGRTETEVACTLNDTPVHRCVLIPKRAVVDETANTAV